MSSAGSHEIVLPIVALYRRFVELSLKECIYVLCFLMRAHDPAFDFNEEQLKCLRDHPISMLLKLLRTMHASAERYLQGGKLPSDQALGFAEELAALDDTGFPSRYLLDKKKRRYITDDWYFNLDVLNKGMEHVRLELSWYATAVEETAWNHRNYLADSEP